ncbi:hypothetical protein PISMIDRAFT_8674 [Pisolithus microcarpus 441]|uniref:Uncharacterized protein n=1 Tax=Pisolithus microcarpus 441 TaxID=765257 RepID=A0A0C9ZLY3_9AGAM|nr:hypothetical protein BKA83DRAFT_8674 [Pisolithus microcarpus]KIK26899.1 hypothetical protein PISMIDRAFT_8674 [Pisolithus microcarpus 441]
MSSQPPFDLVFARAPTITMVDNDLIINVDGFVSDWDTYTFSLNVHSPGNKRIVIRLKNPELTRCHEEVRSPYAQRIHLDVGDPVKTELNDDPIKLGPDEDIKPSGPDLALADCQNTCIQPFFSCTGNPDIKPGEPNVPWKYYIRPFDQSLIPYELTRRKRSVDVADVADENQNSVKHLKTL